MIVHKCDICGASMDVWYSMSIEVETSKELDTDEFLKLVKMERQVEICKECYRMKILPYLEM